MAIQRHSAGKTDRRVLRTRKAIMKAFDTLIRQGDVDKITVSAIAREAGIDRKTFYLHYSSIDDLASRKAEEGIKRVLATLEAKSANKTGTERLHIVLEEINAILTEDVAVYANIASHISVEQLFDHVLQAAEPLPPSFTMPSKAQERMELQFYLIGAWSLYWTWLKSDHRQPIETVSLTIEKIIRAPIMKNPHLFRSAESIGITH